ncbi:MAG: NAD(P)/FAD-dependent oxidoreductase [Clostridia bacterium]|nr:NAD(P)/FAD-dependent oxidoreductase [Clostridia bacterium]
MDKNIRIAVVGGGAAGMMAAGTALRSGADVTVFEHMGRLGKKLAITGKGRCNVTNDSTVTEILENVTKNPRFLFGAMNALPPSSVMSLFEELGVPLKTERGNRVFPVSDKAIDIVNALKKYSSDAAVVFSKVTSVKKADSQFIVNASGKEYIFDRVILATGGRSYPLTGSDGSGFRLARSLGHSVTELLPSLVPLESDSPFCGMMQGLSLKNVGITVTDKNGKALYSDFGEMMFTHFGVTGPLILSASAHLCGMDFEGVKLLIDLKPALDEKTLDARIISDFTSNVNKDFINSLSALLPTKMIEPFVTYTGIDPRKKVNSITKEERKKILSALKGFVIPLKGTRPIEEAIITSGGVSTKEIIPKTMESKLTPGLYFAGEMIDVDAYTGGYNLQIAFATGYLAGKSAAEWSLE